MLHLVVSVYQYALGRNLNQVHHLNQNQIVQLPWAQHQSLLQVEMEVAANIHVNKQEQHSFHGKKQLYKKNNLNHDVIRTRWRNKNSRPTIDYSFRLHRKLVSGTHRRNN